MKPIAQGGPTIGLEEFQAVNAVLEERTLAVGPQVSEFENKFALYLGAPGSVATSSGFAALHLTLLTLRPKSGDEVILPAISSCAAIRDAVFAAGATPVFVDTEPEAPNLCPREIRKALSARTKAIICPHHLGFPSKIHDIVSLGVPVIEDCAQSLGASVSNQLLGNFGYAAVFSFYPTKLMTTIDGGAIVSGDKDILESARELRYYGQKIDDSPRYNYKMQNLHAAVGLVQLEKLDSFLLQRKNTYERYLGFSKKSGEVRGLALTMPNGGVAFRFGIFTKESFDPKRATQSHCFRNEYQALSRAPEKFPNSLRFLKNMITFPTYPGLTEHHIEMVGRQILELLS